MLRAIIGVFLPLLLLPAPALAQPHASYCADCHYANRSQGDTSHLRDWDSSAHERAGLGCEICHGGNPNTVDKFRAHQTIVRGAGRDSPVHRANLPRTCGRCHPGPFAAFRNSHHYELLGAGSSEGPTCSTCHGASAGYLLGPKALDNECGSCHGRNRKYSRADRPANARILLQNIHDIRQLLKRAQTTIAGVDDGAMRASLQFEYSQAEFPVADAVERAHSFDFLPVEDRVATARARTLALLQRLDALRSKRTIAADAPRPDNFDPDGDAIAALRAVFDDRSVTGTCVLIERDAHEDHVDLYFLTAARLFKGGDRARALRSVQIVVDGDRVVDVDRRDVLVPVGEFIDVAIVHARVDATEMSARPLWYGAPGLGESFLVTGLAADRATTAIPERIRFASSRLVIGDRDASGLPGCVGAPASSPDGVFGVVTECTPGRSPVISLLALSREFIERYVPGASGRPTVVD